MKVVKVPDTLISSELKATGAAGTKGQILCKSNKLRVADVLRYRDFRTGTGVGGTIALTRAEILCEMTGFHPQTTLDGSSVQN